MSNIDIANALLERDILFPGPSAAARSVMNKVVAFVRSGGPLESDHPFVTDHLYTTLNAGLAKCRDGYGDTVVVLPGHAENIGTADAMDALVSDCNIVGWGYGAQRPTFTWTLAGATFLLDQAGVTLSNMVFHTAGPAGAVPISVATPIVISGAGCQLHNIEMEYEIDADQSAINAITTTAAADDLLMKGCYFYSGTGGDGTLPVSVVHLVGADRFKMIGCVIDGCTTGAGLILSDTTASLNTFFKDCILFNRTAGGTEVVQWMATSTGIASNCVLGSIGDGGITLAVNWDDCDLMVFDNVRIVTDQPENSAQATTASA